MLYLSLSGSIFICCVIIHILLCRFLRKKDGLLVKPFIFLSLTGLILLWFLFSVLKSYIETLPDIWRLPLSLTSSMLYLLAIPFYLIFYTNTRLVSPSKKILTLIRDSQALTRAELTRHLTNEEFILSRIYDLEQSGCLRKEKGGHYRLARDGIKIGLILEYYEKVIGRRMGG